MPTRTYLTTPPGQEPVQVPGRSASTDEERYAPALAPPSEPEVPGRWRRPLVAVATAVALGLLGAVIVAIVLSSQTQDPALFDPSLLEEPDPEGPTLRDGPDLPDGGEG